MMYKSLAPTFGICLDWETSGSDFEGDSTINYQGISVGAIIFNTRTFEPVADLYREIQFDETRYKWTEGAEKIHELTRNHLKANGVTREDACVDLLEFMIKWLGPSPKPMILAYNAEFDIGFTRQLLSDFGIEFRHHHVVLDVANTTFICFGTYKSDHVFELFGMEKRGSHNALQDAYMCLEVARQYNAIFKELM